MSVKNRTVTRFLLQLKQITFQVGRTNRKKYTMEVEGIAITGISGKFPNANNVEEFKQALLHGLDLITNEHKRWPHESLKTPSSMGILHDFENFDTSFFEINPKAAELHDPRGRKLLEVVFESIMDAGVNPNELRGSNSGVFVGIMQNSLDYNYLKPGSGINSSTYIIANNISYTFDLHGPSYGIDTGCSSSIYALNQAVDSIRLGTCDSAIVCSVHANFLPYDSIEFTNLGVLNPEGKCKTFDDDRNGYVKSEGVVAIFLQKEKDSRRIYATIEGIGCNVDGYKEDGMLHPSSRMQLSLLQCVYQRYGIDPNEIEYIECHGTGTLVGDIEECESIANFFTKGNRTTPLLIGSVKTNVGHTEAAGGLVSLVKLLVTIQSGVIPANIHYKTPAMDIPSIFNGNLQVVAQNTKYKGGLLALNSFGLGGSNGHLVIKPYFETKPEGVVNSKTYRLVHVSGRTEQAVEFLMDKVSSCQNQDRLLALVDEIFSKEIRGYNFRGYCIINGVSRGMSKCTSKRGPIWFSYSGMGSQWPQMAKDLIHFDSFKESLNKCAKPLEPYGIDLHDIVLNGTKETFENPINCFTAIIAVSIGLTDLLYSIGIRPDGIIGHSLGEIGCAYGDGLISAEEAILVAYARGWATKSTKLIPGLMASVGLSCQECEKLLPDDIYIACDNSINNVTVSGPEPSVKLFSEQLSSKGIFVRIVNTANIAFHSKYISSVGPKLLEFLKSINIQPKLRNKWMPSAVEESDWDSDLGRYNSAEYQCHNFLNRVRYNQVLKKVPKNAILIEVAPCGLFQAIFRRALDATVTKLYLIDKHSNNNHEFFLDTIGRLYLTGVQPTISSLFNKTDYPLGPETPMVSPLVKWDHSIKWSIPKYDPYRYFGKKVEINLGSREYKFLSGYMVNGKNLFPIAGYVCLVWQTFANMLGTQLGNIPIKIEKLKLLKTIQLPKNENITFTINILKTGFFEISDKVDVIVTGKIFALISEEDSLFDFTFTSKEISEIKLDTKDVYKTLYLRGHDYEGSFKSVIEVDYNNKTATVKWSKNWTTFLDSLLQTIILLENSELTLPSEISQILISPKLFLKHIDQTNVLLKYDSLQKYITCKGLTVHNVIWSKIPTSRSKENIIKLKYEFVPNIQTHISEQERPEEVLQLILQIIIENNDNCEPVRVLQVTEYESHSYRSVLNKILHPKYLEKLVYNTTTYNRLQNNLKYNLIIFENLVSYSEGVKLLQDVDEGTFIFNEISDNISKISLEELNLSKIFERKTPTACFTLFRKNKTIENTNYQIIKIPENDTPWTETIKESAKEGILNLVLFEENFDLSINGFFDDLQKNFSTIKLRIMCIKDRDVEEFNLNSIFYQQQLKKDLVVNILQDNEWGTYRYLPIKESYTAVESCSLMLLNNHHHWVQENPYRYGERKVNVSYSSLDFWDQLGLSQSPNDQLRLGFEYSGITESRARVMGLAPEGSLKTHLNFHENFTWSVPKRWSLKEAATVPFTYTMCYYGLFVKANLQRHHTILTTFSGTAIDRAAINLIMYIGANVFVGIHSEKSRKLLTNSYPELRDYIVDLSSTEGLNTLMENTRGKGLDIMFNCGNHDILESISNVMKSEGKIVHINFRTTDLSSLKMDMLEKNLTPYILTLDCLLRENYYVLENIRSTIQTYVDNNIIKPFHSDTISMKKVTRLLKNYKQIDNGKITVKIFQKQQIYMKNKYLALPRTSLNPEKCYIVISDLDFIDLEVVKWLVTRGSKKIVINATSGSTEGYLSLFLENLRREGNTVSTSSVDVTTLEGVEKIIGDAEKSCNVGGIFYFAGDSHNSPLSVTTKNNIVRNLDIVSRKLCESLDHFVVFSSMGSNDLDSGITRVTIDSLCEERRKSNLPGLIIRWNPRTFNWKTNKKNIMRQSIPSCLETLDSFIQSNAFSCESIVHNIDGKIENSLHTSVMDSIAKIFGIKNAHQIDPSTPLENLGMDSIIGFELKNLLYSLFDVNYSVVDIRKLTVDKIKNMGKIKTSK